LICCTRGHLEKLTIIAMITRSKRQKMNIPSARFVDMPAECTTLILTLAIHSQGIVRALSVASHQLNRVLKTTAVRRHLVRLGIYPKEEGAMWKHWKICMRAHNEALRVGNEHWGLFSFPESAYVWRGELRPPPCSPYTGKNIFLTCEIPPEYPFKPAQIVFDPFNVPFHPNVHPGDGKLSLSWASHSPGLPLDSWMVAVQNLLANPADTTVRDAANQCAALEYNRDPGSWHQQARRAHQQHNRNSEQSELNIARDNWQVGLLDNVAVLTAAKGRRGKATASFAQIIGMREKRTNIFTPRTRPITIHKAGTDVREIFITIRMYAPIHGSVHEEKRFRLNSQLTQEVALDTVVCPAVLRYNAGGKYHVLDNVTNKILTQQLQATTP